MLVTTCLITYNHEKYISECLDSIINQKCNFKHEIVIGDDSSTDDTASICKAYALKYPSLIRYFKRPKNLGMIGNWLKTIGDAKGKYIAICEGDDYWTDPLKLQRQVDFLESNNDYTICWTNYKILNTEVLEVPTWASDLMAKDTAYYDVDYDNFASPYCTHTLTCVFRAKSFSYIDILKFKFFKDNSLYLKCLQKGKGAVLNFFGGIYRKHDQGIYSLASDYLQAISNYTNYEEILVLIPESRVPNIIGKRNNWKSQFLKTLYARRIPKLKKWYIRGRLLLYFKYLNVINS